MKERGRAPEHVQDVLGRLLKRVEPILEAPIPGGWKVEVSCEVLSFVGFPAIHLEASMVSTLARIGADLDIDVLG
ncbi:MAG: hypothetical protein U0X73_04025 [Thermoanaerobaculia bacterium]